MRSTVVFGSLRFLFQTFTFCFFFFSLLKKNPVCLTGQFFFAIGIRRHRLKLSNVCSRTKSRFSPNHATKVRVLSRAGIHVYSSLFHGTLLYRLSRVRWLPSRTFTRTSQLP
uniref:Uncharacterized protein n=1 Tax=Glypta fumiferanae TaxID=389681 RepID=A0A0F6Q8V1_9HYME|nr:hypothetical protein [Glypta fumiferanae]